MIVGRPFDLQGCCKGKRCCKGGTAKGGGGARQVVLQGRWCCKLGGAAGQVVLQNFLTMYLLSGHKLCQIQLNIVLF